MEHSKVRLLMRDIAEYWSSWQKGNKQAVELDGPDSHQL